MGCQASKEVKEATEEDHSTVVSPTEVIKVDPGRPAMEWTVRPGYSSGASSVAEDEEPVNESTHNICECIKQQRITSGDLAQIIVRMETPYGTQIEQIYSGVHDGPILGSGVSGTVRQIVHRTTNVSYAVKILDIGLVDTEAGLNALRNEISIMLNLDHPSIIRIEEVYESNQEIYIVQELCTGGDLFDRLDQQDDFHYSEAQCAKLVKQMLSAIRYLHSKGIIHRDLKLENFLFSSEDPDSELRLIDFGLSKHFELGQSHNEIVGTPYTVAPELIQGDYNEKADIWSLGVVTFLLLSGETPFGGLDGESLLLVKENIMKAQIRFEPKELWQGVSENAKSFVMGCLQSNPDSRPGARDLQKHTWLQVWSRKKSDANLLNPKTVTSLMNFKESSDMKKLLSEVLSFTLLPEQIVELRGEFEKFDEGDGEISLSSLKRVLQDNATMGTLGAMTESEIQDIFDSIRLRKSDPKIRWHEFLAAALSQAHIDDRNLRLAFDRLDTQHRGFITFEDLKEVLGNATDLEKIWNSESNVYLDRIRFHDFKRIMKGQAESSPLHSSKLLVTASAEMMESLTLPILAANPRNVYNRAGRSKSYNNKNQSPVFEEDKDVDGTESSLIANRNLYRKHRELRHSVLEASKQFDSYRRDQENSKLTMRRGSTLVLPNDDVMTRELYDKAAWRGGRDRRARNKTLSDVSGMIGDVF